MSYPPKTWRWAMDRAHQLVSIFGGRARVVAWRAPEGRWFYAAEHLQARL